MSRQSVNNLGWRPRLSHNLDNSPQSWFLLSKSLSHWPQETFTLLPVEEGPYVGGFMLLIFVLIHNGLLIAISCTCFYLQKIRISGKFYIFFERDDVTIRSNLPSHILSQKYELRSHDWNRPLFVYW